MQLDWRGGTRPRITRIKETYDGATVIKAETLPDGRRKLILKEDGGNVVERVVN